MNKASGQEGELGSSVLHPSPVTRHSSRCVRLLSPLLSLCALLIIFLTLFDWDIPLTRFVRSLNDFHIDHLSNPWLARLSDIGDRLGKGESLVFLSLVIFAVGYGLKHAPWKEAGWQSLLAHGIAALISNVLKHAIGRPRPKFMHAGTGDLAPSGGSGWDSFPSGHAMASCAVAMVLAIRFPKMKWPIMTVAFAIAASRVFRGAHYLSDVAAGAFLGCLAGTVAASPWREWRSSLVSGMKRVMPVTAGIFVALWLLLHLPSDTGLFHALVIGGSVLTVSGLTLHLLGTRSASSLPRWITGLPTRELIGLGLAMTTGSLRVTGVVCLVCLAHWLDGDQDGREVLPPSAVADRSALLRDVLFFGSVWLALAGSYSLKGLVPLF